jgi:hypothetical protein
MALWRAEGLPWTPSASQNLLVMMDGKMDALPTLFTFLQTKSCFF